MICLNLNYLAIITVSIICNVFRAFWYSSLIFGKLWIKLSGIKQKNTEKSNQKKFILNILCNLIMAFVLGIFIKLTGANTFIRGIIIGLLAGIGISAASSLIDYHYTQRSIQLFLIHYGYILISLIIIGGILAVWQ